MKKEILILTWNSKINYRIMFNLITDFIEFVVEFTNISEEELKVTQSLFKQIGLDLKKSLPLDDQFIKLFKLSTLASDIMIIA